MANSVTARFNDDCKVFVSMSDNTTVEKAVIIDAEGNETDIGGGGGGSDFSTAEVTLNLTVEGKSIIASSLDVLKFLFPREGMEYILTNNITTDNKCVVLLYQGNSTAEGVTAVDSNEDMYNTIVGTPVTSGGVSWNSDKGLFEITGNGSITATLSA